MAASLGVTCDVCTKTFSDNGQLNKHKKLIHGIDLLRKNFQCDICQNTGFTFFSQLLEHYVLCHNFQVEEIHLEFPTFIEFNAWKILEEKKSVSKFIKKTGSKRMSNQTVKHSYICHRSGSHESSGQGLRKTKSQGSCKMGTCCFASIIAHEANGNVSVTYQSRHYGHGMDIGHLQLTTEAKASVAVKLKEGVTIQAILDNIRNNVNGGELERVMLTTKQDIRNILVANGIDCQQKLHKDDKTSVNIFVNSLKMKNDSSIRYYKPQCEPDEDGVLMDSDFMLVIMTEPQKQLLQSLGKEKILIDSTHGTNEYDFNLTSIVCIDEFGSGFPCAFCISTKVDTKSMYKFFMKIQDAAGRIETKVFMSDDAAAYYNAWVQAMATPNQRLLCIWHVDRNWRQNILKLIKGTELQVTMYKCLRVLLECSDQINFHELLKSFLENASIEIQDFLQYFKNIYASRPEVWAYCYRQKCGLNTNVYLESLHKVLKYCYMDGKKNRRIDQLLRLLFKLVRDKLFERIIKLTKGASSHRKSKIEASHQLSEKLISENAVSEVENDGPWIVKSAGSRDLHHTVVREHINDCSCKLNCVKCKACIHSYSCTCFDFLIHFNMCKHIHAVIQWNIIHSKQHVQNVSLSADNDAVEQSASILRSVANLNYACGSTSTIAHSAEQAKILHQVNTLVIDLSQHKLSKAQCSEIQTHLSAIRTLVRGAEKLENIKTNSGSRKIEKQPRFHSVKKARKNTALAMRKPTMGESDVIREVILNPNVEVIDVHSEFDHIY